jgi:hypothetical protein
MELENMILYGTAHPIAGREYIEFSYWGIIPSNKEGIDGMDYPYISTPQTEEFIKEIMPYFPVGFEKGIISPVHGPGDELVIEIPIKKLGRKQESYLILEKYFLKT